MHGVYRRVSDAVHVSIKFECTHSCAALNVVFTHRVSVIHGVESSNLIDTHWWHFQSPSDLVHDADAAESVLPLAEIEKRHNSGLLVLRGVPGDDLLDNLFILGGELEWDIGVILGGVSMLMTMGLVDIVESKGHQKELTTMSASLRAVADTANDLHWGFGVLLASWAPALKRNGVSLEAIVAAIVSTMADGDVLVRGWMKLKIAWRHFYANQKRAVVSAFLPPSSSTERASAHNHNTSEYKTRNDTDSTSHHFILMIIVSCNSMRVSFLLRSFSKVSSKYLLQSLISAVKLINCNYKLRIEIIIHVSTHL